MPMDFDEDLNITHRHVLSVSDIAVATRVGGNPESTSRFQTHFMSNLVHAEVERS